MAEIVTRYRTIHRDDPKSPRQDIPAGKRVNLDAEHANSLRAAGAAFSPRQAERQQRQDGESVLEKRMIAGRDPGADAEAEAAAERAAAAANGDGNTTREPPADDPL